MKKIMHVITIILGIATITLLACNCGNESGTYTVETSERVIGKEQVLKPSASTSEQMPSSSTQGSSNSQTEVPVPPNPTQETLNSPAEAPESISIDPLPINNDYYDSHEYVLEIAKIMQQEIVFLLGKDTTPRAIKDRYGEPIEKRPHVGEEWQDVDYVGIWTFPQGFEINVGKQNDRPIIQNYIYLSATCELKLSTGIGIGSTREDIYDAYGELINPKLTNNIRVTLDDDIFFLISDGVVDSIYISTGDFDLERYFIPGD